MASMSDASLLLETDKWRVILATIASDMISHCWTGVHEKGTKLSFAASLLCRKVLGIAPITIL